MSQNGAPHPPPRGRLDPELNQLRTIVQQRSMAAFGEWLDGFTFMLAAAEAGDPGARQIVQKAGALLERARVLAAGLVLPN